MDAAPGALGAVEGRAVGGAWDDTESRVRVAVTGKGLSVVVVTMVLPHDLGCKVAPEDTEDAAWYILSDPGGVFVELPSEGIRVLAGGVVGACVAGSCVVCSLLLLGVSVLLSLVRKQIL